MATHGRIGNNLGFVSSLTNIDYSAFPNVHYNFRKNNIKLTLTEDRWYASRPFAIGKGDDLSVVLDNDVLSKRFDVPMYRRISLVGNVSYTNAGTTITDFDNVMFGPASATQFPFEDFAIVMQPRVRTNIGTSSEILWRWKRFGANNVGIEYDLQLLPNSATSWSVDSTLSSSARAKVLLPTGAARNLTTLTVNTRIAVANIAEVSPSSPHEFWLMTGYTIATLQSDGTDTTVTIASPTGITLTGTGLTNGDQVYLTVDAGIPWIASNLYTVHSVSGVTFKVSAATGGPQGPTAGATSYVTLDLAPGANWTNVQVGDTLVLNTAFSAPAIIAGKPLIVTVVPLAAGGIRALRAKAKYGNAAAVTVPVLSGTITTPSNVSAFPSGDTIAAILSGTTLDPNMPFTGTGIGVGGSVLLPTWYAASDNTVSYPMVDGINYIKTTTITPSGGGYNYSVTFKNLIDASLSGYTLWQYEEAYLCPVTAANVCSYLNNLAVCGLSANGRAETSSRGSKVQIATSTMGSVGSVQIRGGLANGALANVRGSATETNNFLACNVVVPTTQISGFHGAWPVKITNSLPYLKVNDLVEKNLISIVGNVWTVGPALGSTVATSHAEANVHWQFEKQGNLMAMVWYSNGGGVPTITGYGPGDYIVVSNNIGDTVSQANTGTFIITAMDEAGTTIYFENANGVEERAIASTNEIARDSLMPGDVITVGSDVWGVLNRGTFVVDTVGYVSDGLAPTFTTVETPAVTGPVTGPQPTVQIQSGRLHSFIKTVNFIVPLTEDPAYSVVSLVKDANDTTLDAVSENYGSQLSALCKLAFPVATTLGTDGYAHSVGLIGEADKIMYGYETDPVSYPGVVAAGSNINISGPLVKRIQIGLSLRVRGTVNTVFEAVRGAVATFINTSKVGEPIAISDIVSVASSIGGVEAVAVSSPTYTTTADRITVQPYEKPLVLQPELDITLTLIG